MLIEQIEDVYYRTLMKDLYSTTVSVSIGYAENGGIRKQFTDKNRTNIFLYPTFLLIFQ